MQTEEEVKTNGEYHSNAIEASTEYPFDSPTVSVELLRGKDSILTIKFEKPELDHYLDLEKATERVDRLVDGALIGETKSHNANEEFFNALVQSASARKRDSKTPFVEYDAEQCKNFAFEIKDEAVSKLNAASFEVVDAADELGLFDSGGSLTVRQKIGDVDNPSYVIDYHMNALPKAQRQEYLSAIRIKRRVKNGKTSLETEVHVIKKAMKLFGPNLQSIEGGRMEMGPFTPDRKAEFIKMIDPMFQVGVVDALVGYYSKGLD